MYRLKKKLQNFDCLLVLVLNPFADLCLNQRDLIFNNSTKCVCVYIRNRLYFLNFRFDVREKERKEIES